MFNSGFIKKTLILILVFIAVISLDVIAAGQAHSRPEMVYRIRIANDLDFMNSKFSGIKVNDIRLPDYEDIKINDDPWSYIVVYIGVENIWFYQGNEMLHAVEAGLSIRGTEVNDKSGWHSFSNYYPKKKYSPYNDPDAWRGRVIDTSQPVDLALKVGKMEKVEQSYRWNVYFYVNGREIAVRPIYANPGESNQFDVKLCVGTYMASGNENEVSFAPFKIGDIEVTTSSVDDKSWQDIKLENFGIPHHRIGYGTEVNNTEHRQFNTEFEGEDFSYAVELKEDRMSKEEKNGLILFTILAGLISAAGN